MTDRKYFNRLLKDAKEDNDYIGTVLDEVLSYINDTSVYVLYKSYGSSCYVYQDFDKALNAFDNILHQLKQEDRDQVRLDTMVNNPDLVPELIDGGVVLRSAMIPGDLNWFMVLVSTKIE